MRTPVPDRFQGHYDHHINLIHVLSVIISKAQSNDGAQGRESGVVTPIKHQSVDLILMDVHMPEMNGLEATRRIRQLQKNHPVPTPIVALTAGAIKEEKEKCLEAGMDDFLSKPINQKTLRNVLARYLPRKQHIPGDVAR